MIYCLMNQEFGWTDKRVQRTISRYQEWKIQPPQGKNHLHCPFSRHKDRLNQQNRSAYLPPFLREPYWWIDYLGAFDEIFTSLNCIPAINEESFHDPSFCLFSIMVRTSNIRFAKYPSSDMGSIFCNHEIILRTRLRSVIFAKLDRNGLLLHCTDKRLWLMSGLSLKDSQAAW